MQKSGQITVFLSLVLMCIFSLMCGLLESARTAGTRFYLKLAADSAMDSVFSGYHKEVWDKYRIFLLECEDGNQLGEAWKEFMEPYMENSGWYSMTAEKADITAIFRITDDGGKYLNQEIQDYMRYGIFENITDEEGARGLLEDLKEAGAVKKISQAYGSHTREAVRLERALEDINDSLQQQKNDWQGADDRIGAYDGSGFREYVSNLQQETERIPSLVKTYGKRADELKKKIRETDGELSGVKEELSQGVRETLYADTACYESYIEKDGERRMEIEALPEEMARVKQTADRARERSHEVEEIIADWEGDDEDDEGPDESSLWDSVRNIWHEAEIPVLSYSTGVRDPEKQKLLEQVEGFVEGGLLNLVLPEGSEISKGILLKEDLPSAAYGEGQSPGLVDRIMFDEYCGNFLTCFTSEEDKEVKYELEYLIAGKNTDEENLKQSVREVLMIREGMNLIHILTDSRKREEARALAGVITGASGLVPLTGVVAFFVMTVWAMGESVIDVRMLLEGKKSAFVKSGETWNLSLADLLESGRSGTFTGGGEDEKGVDYTGYLKLLLFTGEAEKQYYRLMDVIQLNICRKQEDFRMAHCIYQAEVRGTVKSRHMFFGGTDPFYRLEVRTEKAY
ncbi:DUF5702 domain-containing protein [Lachnospiraceae bacterium 54-53]